MKKTWKRLCTGFLALATVVTALPTTPVHAESKQYWTESAERVGIIEKVMNDGSIGSTFNEGYMKVEGETAYCIDINTDFKNGYKTRADASSRMSADQISDVALSLEYVKQYGEAHKELNYKQVYLAYHAGWTRRSGRRCPRCASPSPGRRCSRSCGPCSPCREFRSLRCTRDR